MPDSAKPIHPSSRLTQGCKDSGSALDSRAPGAPSAPQLSSRVAELDGGQAPPRAAQAGLASLLGSCAHTLGLPGFVPHVGAEAWQPGNVGPQARQMGAGWGPTLAV